MFARTVRMQLKPNSVAEFTSVIEKEIIPLLRKQQGFRDEITFLRVLFLLPQTDCDRFLAVVRWEERDFVPEALLLAKQGDDFLLDHRSKLRNAVGLQLHANGSGKHVNLPRQLRLRRVQITCLRSDDLKK